MRSHVAPCRFRASRISHAKHRSTATCIRARRIARLLQEQRWEQVSLSDVAHRRLPLTGREAHRARGTNRILVRRRMNTDALSREGTLFGSALCHPIAGRLKMPVVSMLAATCKKR